MSFRVISLPRFRESRSIFLCLALLMVVTLGRLTATSMPQNVTTISHTRPDYSEESPRQQFAKNLGWEIGNSPIEVVDIKIPLEFNKVYENYNMLQKKQGFNLLNYKGKAVKRYTYKILNYPDYDSEVRLNILVYKGKIIGGDVCSIELEGFMQGFNRS